MLSMNFRRLILFFLSASCLNATQVFSQIKTENFPFQETQSSLDAHKQQIDNDREWAEYHFEQAERECYKKILVNACLDKAKRVKKIKLQALKDEEVQVDTEQRRLITEEHDRKDALRQQQEKQDAPTKEAERRANAAAYDAKQKAHAEKIDPNAQVTQESPGQISNSSDKNALTDL